jgi:GNAT superfamily N-acetyltransferase
VTKRIREFGGGLVVCRTGPEHVDQLEQLQRIVFPTLAADERFEARHYLRHLELFPEGQFCVVDGARVVGMTSTVRLDFDFDHPGHTFADIIQGGWLTSHQPAGRWLYGADVGVHPEYRRRKIARALYAARHETVRRLGLAGQVTVGMPSGYGAVKQAMTAEAYVAELIAGTRSDPTISAQLRIGFELRQLLPDYINDPVCAGYGVVLVLPAERDVPFP